MDNQATSIEIIAKTCIAGRIRQLIGLSRTYMMLPYVRLALRSAKVIS